jgi:hypothetical protein
MGTVKVHIGNRRHLHAGREFEYLDDATAHETSTNKADSYGAAFSGSGDEIIVYLHPQKIAPPSRPVNR